MRPIAPSHPKKLTMFNAKAFFSLAAFHFIGVFSIRTARSLGSILGRIGYLFNVRMTKVTRENIQICLPSLSPKASEELVKHSLQETGKTAAEICVLWCAKQSPLNQYVHKITGEALVQSLLGEGRGLIVLAPHLGNWEILGHYLATLGRVTNLYQPPKLTALDPLIRSSRAKAGCELVPADVRGVAMLLKNLKNGGISGILPDQNPNDIHSGQFIPFFNEPALTMVLIYKLMQRTQCNVVFAFAKRVDNGFELVFREAPKDIASDDMTLSLNALNQGIEALVLEAPEQYQWEYKRFKNTCPKLGIKRYD